MSAVRLGFGGPVGSGKTRLVERLLPLFAAEGISVAVITNDLVTDEDAERVKRSGLIDPERVLGVESGACPHTAIREDPSVNIEAAGWLEHRFEPDVIFIESGGDNLAATFSSELVDWWAFVIDVAGGDDIPRKRGLGVMRADLLVINKIDLAIHVDADMGRISDDVSIARPEKASLYTDLRSGKGVNEVFEEIKRSALFGRLNE
ncbi:urease accessory protein UreG [Vreelandella glaciei]|uniref:urease accessory protein UreG n=1 Tax=Vreelandella glaciei TaxID=186761 RepID=UPI0030EEE054|tara:strand:+ start:10274 stop:10888 length:615 start_codon:yes stop_codon:yes gene_type:complete